MGSRTVVLVVVLAALAVAVLLLLNQTGSEIEDLGPVDSTSGDLHDPTPFRPPAPVTTDESPDPTRAVADDSRQPVRLPAAEGICPVTGRITLINPRGGERTAPSGTIALRVARQQQSLERELEVRDGLFDLQVPVGTNLTARSARLDGHSTTFPGADTLLVEGPVVWELEAHWHRNTRLNVVDALTGEHLEGLNLSRDGNDLNRRPLVLPSNTHEVIRNGNSPLEIPSDGITVHTYWCRAPGYAWKRITIDPVSAGERTLLLERAGRLEVTLNNHDPRSNAVLRLRNSSSTVRAVAFEMTPGSTPQPIVLDDLPADTYRVTVELGDLGDWSAPPIILAEGEIELLSGQLRQLSLLLNDPPGSAELVPLRGTLVLPSGWGAPRGDLTFRLQGDSAQSEGRESRLVLKQLEMVDTAAHRRAFDAGLLAPGRFSYQLDRYGVTGSFSLPEEGRTDLALTVPAPGELILEVVDRDTGRPLRPDSLCWAPEPDNEDWSGMPVFCQAPPPPEPTRLAVPLGPIRIHARCMQEYGPAEVRTVIQPGPNRVRLEMARACKLTIEFVEGEAVVPFDGGLATITSDAHESAITSTITDGRTVTYTLVSAGTYNLEIPPPAGFAPLPPRQIQIDRGEQKTLRIELERQ